MRREKLKRVWDILLKLYWVALFVAVIHFLWSAGTEQYTPSPTVYYQAAQRTIVPEISPEPTAETASQLPPEGTTVPTMLPEAKAQNTAETEITAKASLKPIWTIPPDSVVNQGDAAALDALPGVGPTIAERIIEYREEHGNFVYPEDLLGVKGIGQSKMTAIVEVLQAEKKTSEEKEE